MGFRGLGGLALHGINTPPPVFFPRYPSIRFRFSRPRRGASSPPLMFNLYGFNRHMVVDEWSMACKLLCPVEMWTSLSQTEWLGL